MGDPLSRKTIITGTLILTTASLITKMMGFYYRVYMSDAIGAEGMGLYQLILPIYSLAWSITSSGFTTTISRLTAQENVKGESGNIGRIVKQSLCFSLIISLLVSGALFLFANPIAIHILKESRTNISLKFLAFAIPFMATGSCFRGYFLGLQNAVIPAISQVLEQSVRIFIIFTLAGLFVPYGLKYACLAAVSGIIAGEVISCLFNVYQYLSYKKKNRLYKRPSLSAGNTARLILAMALPLSASRIITSLLSTVENILIPRQLQLFGQNASEALSTYGELTGMAMPLILLPSSFLMAASLSLVPEISEASAAKQGARIERTVSITFLFTFIVGIGSCAVFAVFPNEICYVVYNREGLGAILFPLAFLCPFLYAQITLNGLLNGLGEQGFLFFNNLGSSLIAIGIIWFFMPHYGIPAFLCGWAASLGFSVMDCLHKLRQRTGAFPDFKNCFLKPLLAGGASGLLVRYFLWHTTPTKLIFLLALGVMGVLYLFFLFLLGCFSGENRDVFFRKS